MSLTGTSIPASTSIDSLFSVLFPTRSADLAGTPIYSWADENGTLIGSWPNQTNYPAMYARFEARPNAPSVLNSIGRGGGLAVTDSITAISGGSFTIPAVGASVAVSVAMPWVDLGDTVSVNDGTRQFKGTVLANSGTTITLLNPGYRTNGTGTMASGSPVSLAPRVPGHWSYVYGSDDFLDTTISTTSGYNDFLQSISGTAGAIAAVPWQVGHPGIFALTGPTSSVGFTQMFRQIGLVGTAGIDLTKVLKLACRYVISFDTMYSSSKGEMNWGFTDGASSNTHGALWNIMPGFVDAVSNTAGMVLIAGSYNGGTFYDINTSFTVAPNIWYDTVIVYTPAAGGTVKFYAAQYGSTPQLLLTTTGKIGTSALVYNNYDVTNYSDTVSRRLYVDKEEWLIQVDDLPQFMGEDLLSF